jgi:hypothetical protein
VPPFDESGAERRTPSAVRRAPSADSVTAWLEALAKRHQADLTTREIGRALRALSSCYVERRAKLSEGDALSTTGKRAAFALFYGPLHFFVIRNILRSVPAGSGRLEQIIDVGCGTGAAGAAWADVSDATRMAGFDRNPWAVAEANWTYRQFQIGGRAIQQDLSRLRIRPSPDCGIAVAYVANELPADARDTLRAALLAAHTRGARLLVVEPIARRLVSWWDGWAGAFERAGGRADEWRFPADLPPLQQSLARAAGLDPRELTARSLWLS